MSGRGRCGRAAAALLAALVLIVLGTPTAPVHAGAAPPAPRPTGVSVELAAQTAWVPPDGSFDLALRVQGAPAGTRLAVRVHPAVTGRIRFDQSIRGENLGTPLRPGPPEIGIDVLPRDARGALLARYPVTTGPPPPFGVRITEPGVYPVTVELVDPDGRRLDGFVTHLIRLPTASASSTPLEIALVAPLHAPVAHQPDGSVRLREGDRERLDALVRALADEPGVPLTIVPTPETLDALADADARQGSTTIPTLRVAIEGRQVLSRPYVDLDWGAWVATGDDPELIEQIKSGNDTVGALLGLRPDARSWVLDPTVTPDALTRLRGFGVEQVVVPDPQLDPLPGRLAEAPLTRSFTVTDGAGDPMPAVATDPDLARRLRQTTDPVLNGHLALADLAVLHGYAPSLSRGAVLALPAAQAIPSTTLDVLLTGLAAARDLTGTGAAAPVRPVTVAGLFDVIEPVTLREAVLDRPYRAEPPGSLGDFPQRAATARFRLAGYRSLLGPEAARALPLERSLLIAGADELDGTGRLAYLDAVTAAVDTAVAGIVVPPQQAVTLTSESGRIPVTLENTLPHPVEVALEFRSAKLEFPEGARQTVVLAPGGPTQVDVAVRTRASGAFRLDLDVRSPDGTLPIARNELTVRSTAISGLGLLLSIAAGVFLALWWARHFRKVRRNRLLVSTAHPAVRHRPAPSTVAETASATLPATTGSRARPGVNEGEHVRSPHRH